MKLFANLFIAALLFPMGAAAQSLKVAPVSGRYQLEALGMSENHRYVTGLNIATYKGFIWDTQTDSVVEHTKDYLNCDFRAVTNDGRAFGILGEESMVTTYAAWFDMEGEEYYLENFEPSQCFDVTPDGRIAVGCLIDTIMWFPTACIWRDGVRELLPVPTPEECGFSHDGANAQFISSDGSVIAGYLQDDLSSRPAIVWLLQADGSYAYNVISSKYWSNDNKKLYRTFQCLALSDNGEWLAIAAKPRDVNEVPQPERVARYHLKTNRLQVSTKPYDLAASGEESYPSGIANDGTLVGSIIYESIYRMGLIWKANKTCAETMANFFADVKQLSHYDELMHSGIAISGDAQYICGYGLPIIVQDGEVDYQYESYLLDTGNLLGISQLSNVVPAVPSVHDLSGRRTQTSKGLQIVNGQVVFLMK